MASQIGIRTTNEQVTQNYELPRGSKAAQPNSLEPVMVCNKVEEAGSADTDHSCPEVPHRQNYPYTSHQRIQPAADVSQIKNVEASLAKDELNQLTGRYCNGFASKRGTAEAECHNLTCSHQVPHCFVLPCVDVCHNLKDGAHYDGKCRRNTNKSEMIDASLINEAVKSKEDEATQTSLRVWQERACCSKPIHLQKSQGRSVKSNRRSRRKCTCKGLCGKSSRKCRDFKASVTNARGFYLWNQIPPASNDHHQAGCRRVIHIIATPNHTAKRHWDVLKCHGCGRHVLYKRHQGRSSGIHHHIACHPHSNHRNHSSTFRHTHCYKHN